MKISEVPIGKIFLMRHSGKDVAWSQVYEYVKLGYSDNGKAVKLMTTNALAVTKDNPSYQWRSVEDLDAAYEVFDTVTHYDYDPPGA